MTTGSVDLIAPVDGAFRVGADSLDDGKAFLGAKFAVARAKGFGARDGVAFPEDIHGKFDVLAHFIRWCSFWYELAEVVGERIRFLVLEEEASGVGCVLLHPFLDVLLGVANVPFARCEAGRLVDDDGLSAKAIVQT